MTRSRRIFALALALHAGCVFGSRPGLPTDDDSGLGGTANYADTSDPTRAVDAAAMPPHASVDAGFLDAARDAARDAVTDGASDVSARCDGGDAGDAPDAGDAHACDDASSQPRPGTEIHP